MESTHVGALHRLNSTQLQREVGRFVSSVRQNRLAWALIGLWALAMMSLPIVLWTVGNGFLPNAVTVTTGLQAIAVIVVLGTAWGWQRTLASIVTIAVLGWLVEYIGSTTGVPFGAYTYTARLQPHLSGVPLLIPVAWFMLLPCAWTVAAYIADGRRWLFVLLSVLAFVAWDLFLDPQMVTWDFWRWSQPSGYFGIPWSNYIGWALAALVMTLIVRPPAKPLRLLLVIYGLTWFFETFGLLFFWNLVGPALIGSVVMGGFLIAALWKMRHTAQ
ncbi:MAG: carotenoid biosynthesis protein [Anaerolineae bacterium]|nr:carotenoid biosynthesis protein [Anaerolineae bacterium]